jgi:hypothetical protein
MNYFNFPMKESIQNWRRKWFYLKEKKVSSHRSDPSKFLYVLEVTLKKSWRNNLTAKEKPVANKLYEKILELKNVGGQMMIGTKSAALFLKHRIQPVMSRTIRCGYIPEPRARPEPAP